MPFDTSKLVIIITGMPKPKVVDLVCDLMHLMVGERGVVSVSDLQLQSLDEYLLNDTSTSASLFVRQMLVWLQYSTHLLLHSC